MEYTKGEWRVSNKSFGGCDTDGNIVIRSDEEIVAMACTINEGLVNAEANARLIAQAPRLYEACSLVERAWVGDGVDMAMAVDACLLAIAEVEG